MPAGVIKSTEQIECFTCKTLFTKKHYASKFCSKTCYHKDVYRKNRNKELNKGYRLQKTYGISLEDFNMMQKQQNFKCQICNEQPKVLFVDHCHTTNEVRGLLCRTCNFLLGNASDNVNILESAIKYLQKDLKALKGIV